eukprot:TRINITY_DN4153_c0_g1_i1.p1 TRINITY_DN4153_c0_g1~~TRINITY_DN4153_c0_g1_i1.p1  ORF type:complete len:294 (+),score=56.76 TRINITY_DN4153_c0_g1_i1:71-883(+)
MKLYAPDFALYLILTVIYASTIVGWTYNWKKQRANQAIPLHRFIGYCLFLEFIIVFLATIYYGILLVNGFQAGRDKIGLVIVADLVSIIGTGIFYCLLMMIAKGWCIVSSVLPRRFRSGLSTFMVVYVFCRLAILVSSRFLQVLFGIILIGLYIGVLYYVFTTISRNLRMLQSRLRGSDVGQEMQAAAAPSHQQQHQQQHQQHQQQNNNNNNRGYAVTSDNDKHTNIYNGEDDNKLTKEQRFSPVFPAHVAHYSPTLAPRHPDDLYPFYF